MFDTLEQALQVFVARTMVLATNPTECTWLSFLQSVIPALIGLWLVRVVVLAVRGALFSRHATTDGADWSRVSEVFASAKESFSRRETGRGRGRGRKSLTSWLLHSRRIAILPSPDVLICNVGFLRPAILVSQGALDALDDDELQAAILHELAHVMALDNLKRAVTESSFVLVPVLVWALGSTRVLRGGDQTLFWLMAIGLTAGALVRALLLRLVTYWQERRADEVAASSLGDRLTVASALVKTGMGFGVRQPAAVSHFSFLFAPTSTRVHRLMAEPRVHSRMQQWTTRAVRLLVVAAMLFGGLAAVRASVIYAQDWDSTSMLRVAGAAPAEERLSALSRGLSMIKEMRFSSTPPGAAEISDTMTGCAMSFDANCMPDCDWEALLGGNGVCLISGRVCDESSPSCTSECERPELSQVRPHLK